MRVRTEMLEQSWGKCQVESDKQLEVKLDNRSLALGTLQVELFMLDKQVIRKA